MTIAELRAAATTETIRHYLQFVTKITQMAPQRWFIDAGERFTIEIGICEHDLSKSYDLMNLWKKHGFVKEKLKNHVWIETYFTEPDGSCYGRYNITEKNGKVNFDYVLPFTMENAAQLIAECIRMREMDIR